MISQSKGIKLQAVSDSKRVDNFIRESVYPHLTHYVARVDGDEVVLEGVAHSFHVKQLAQNIVSRCPGVERVTNRICVEHKSIY